MIGILCSFNDESHVYQTSDSFFYQSLGSRWGVQRVMNKEGLLEIFEIIRIYCRIFRRVPLE